MKDEIDWDKFDIEDPSSFLEKSGLEKVSLFIFPFILGIY